MLRDAVFIKESNIKISFRKVFAIVYEVCDIEKIHSNDVVCEGLHDYP